MIEYHEIDFAVIYKYKMERSYIDSFYHDILSLGYDHIKYFDGVKTYYYSYGINTHYEDEANIFYINPEGLFHRTDGEAIVYRDKPLTGLYYLDGECIPKENMTFAMAVEFKALHLFTAKDLLIMRNSPDETAYELGLTIAK